MEVFMAKTYDKTYEESGTFSPRVAKRFLDIDFIVEYSAAQRGALNLVNVKRCYHHLI